MRLTRPTLSPPVIVTCETKDLPGNLFNTNLKNDITSVMGGESLAVGQFLLVPQSFGYVEISMYIFEFFQHQFYIFFLPNFIEVFIWERRFRVTYVFIMTRTI